MPHQTTTWQVWMRYNHEAVNAEYDRWETTASQTGIALRSTIGKQLFEELPEEDRNEWEGRAKAMHEEECEKYKSRMTGDPSTDPEEQAE